VRSGGLMPRLRELVERPFVRGWPSGYVAPVADATISSRAAHWPNAPRAYRNGTHEGFDFYGGAISGTATIEYGTPIVAVADGVVLRADHDYVELTEAATTRSSPRPGVMSTPPEILDQLRGRQVWVEHVGGFVSRYAHLSDVPDDVQVGARVVQGQVVGLTGNSGTIEAATGTRDDPHPHVEIWRGVDLPGPGPGAGRDLRAGGPGVRPAGAAAALGALTRRVRDPTGSMTPRGPRAAPTRRG
jgi:murein DD-endopeptidase MepM/ murein hydrolase activator NlpD